MHAHHLSLHADVLAGNQGRGRICLLPGSPGRAQLLMEHFDNAELHTNPRRLDVVTGTLTRNGRTVDVAAVTTGMGCPSVDIVVGELIHCGVRRMLRIGTTGTLRQDIALGDLVIASGAVKDVGAPNAYVPPEYPAMADSLWVQAMEDAAIARGWAERTHVGIVHTKDAFWGRQLAEGPDAERNTAYLQRLSDAGVLTSEMEVAHLLTMGSVYDQTTRSVANRRSTAAGIRCGAMLAVIGSWKTGPADGDLAERTEADMLELALDAIVRMDQLETEGL